MNHLHSNLSTQKIIICYDFRRIHVVDVFYVSDLAYLVDGDMNSRFDFCSAWPRTKLITKITVNHHLHHPPTDWQESWSCLGLEETLGLVQNFGGCLVSVSSRLKIFQTVLSRSCLVCFNFIQSRLGLVLICMCSFQK